MQNQNMQQSNRFISEQIDIAKFRLNNLQYYVKIYYSVNFDNFGIIIYKLIDGIDTTDIFIIKEKDYEMIGKYPLEKHQVTLLKNLLLRAGNSNINIKHVFDNTSEKLTNRLFIDVQQNSCKIGGLNGQNVQFQTDLFGNIIDYFNFLSAIEYGEKIAVANAKSYTLKFNKKAGFPNNNENQNMNSNGNNIPINPTNNIPNNNGGFPVFNGGFRNNQTGGVF